MEPPPLRKGPLGVSKEALKGQSQTTTDYRGSAHYKEQQYRAATTRPKSNLALHYLKLLILLIVLIGGGIAGWYYFKPKPEPLADTAYVVRDKLLIPGDLLTSAERNALGYRKTKWIEPKFIFLVSGQQSGTGYAYEVNEKIFNYVPRNTVMKEDEFLSAYPMLSGQPGSNDLKTLQGLQRFSTINPSSAPAK